MTTEPQEQEQQQDQDVEQEEEQQDRGQEGEEEGEGESLQRDADLAKLRDRFIHDLGLRDRPNEEESEPKQQAVVATDFPYEDEYGAFSREEYPTFAMSMGGTPESETEGPCGEQKFVLSLSSTQQLSTKYYALSSGSSEEPSPSLQGLVDAKSSPLRRSPKLDFSQYRTPTKTEQSTPVALQSQSRSRFPSISLPPPILTNSEGGLTASGENSEGEEQASPMSQASRSSAASAAPVAPQRYSAFGQSSPVSIPHNKPLITPGGNSEREEVQQPQVYDS